MMKKFGALRFVAGLYRVLAWIVLIGGILFGLITMVLGALGSRAFAPALPGMAPRMGLGGILGGVFMGLLIILGAALYFLLLYATAEVIYLGLSIEENTREMATYLKAQSTRSAPTWEQPPYNG